MTAAAGVAKGTFYNYFSTKEDLALAAVVPLVRQAQAELGEAPSPSPPPVGLRVQLERLLALLGSWSAGSPELIWVWATELMRRGVAHAGSAMFHELVTGLFVAAQRRGEARPDRTPEELALGLEGILLSNVTNWYHGGARDDLGAALRRATEMYLTGAQAPRS